MTSDEIGMQHASRKASRMIAGYPACIKNPCMADSSGPVVSSAVAGVRPRLHRRLLDVASGEGEVADAEGDRDRHDHGDPAVPEAGPAGRRGLAEVVGDR